MKQFQRTAIAAGAAQFVLMASGVLFAHSALADDTTTKKDDATTTVVVVGQRAALESAAMRKKTSDEIVDSIVADDIGKLPDKSVTEVLQRVVGVTIDRTMNLPDKLQGVGDAINHFAAEGTGVTVRGMSYVRSELNGRDSFSANGGRSLSFEDVPPELMAGVDVYKNPSAEQIEGAIGGLVNLRTALPFDFKGAKGAVSVQESRSQLRGKNSPSLSGLVSNRWKTGFGEFGALLDLARSRIDTRSDGMQISPYIARTDAVVGDTSGATRWISGGGSWTTNNFERERDGLYGALQWKKDSLSSHLTYFRSKYDMSTTEAALSASANPATIMLDPGAVFDDRGVLLAGTIRAPKDPGVGIGTDSRSTGRTSDTRDVAWNLQWRATDQWVFSGDLQHTRATTDGYDNTVGMGAYAPKEGVDFRSSPPKLTFDDADRAFLANPNNYYWGFTQEHRDEAVAAQNAARLDAKFTFDSPVLNDLRFGVRFTNRSAETRATHGNNQWHEITQPWAVGSDGWQPFSKLAYLSDPRFAGNASVVPFNNFFGGKVAMPPSIVVPNLSLSQGTPPPGFAQLHDMVKVLCNGTCSGDALWDYALFGDPESRNLQHEKTKAAYAQLRFGFDTLRYPVDGNVGVRVVRTDMSAAGYLLFSPPDTSKLPTVPKIAATSDPRSFDNQYTNVLPSLNLRMKASDQLQFRAAFSKGMTRPDFYQMQTYTTLSQNVHTHTDKDTNATILDGVDYTGTGVGNPMLKPTRSNNFDLTAEYYFGHGGQLTLALFNKRLSDIIVGKTSFTTLNDSTGQPHDFAVTSPVNGATGRASGAEIGYQQYFDKLPGLLSGLGVSANYTYIDSRQDLGKPLAQVWCTPQDNPNTLLARDLSGCDTDGHLLNVGNVPMTGMSKNALNLAVLYDKGPVSARVAYSWRSKYLQAINAYGTNGNDGIDANPASPNFGKNYVFYYALPTWGGAYGQVDASLQYKFTDNLNVSVQATNLTNALFKQYMQQGIGMMERGAFYTGRSYSVRMGYTF
ncbi:TonB-dependent receptor [Massilia luteola]|uniref:TonB-dependent receptor n=1 Tax=Massilia luteola TaxID=3081751 RepID=UPI002ACBF93A|nr:TonB-dependent receptor [Massilia sp. Gc5]